MNEKQIQQVRQRLRSAIEDAGSDPTAVSREIGRGKDYVRDFLDGRKHSLAASAVAAIEAALGLSHGYIMAATEPESRSTAVIKRTKTKAFSPSVIEGNQGRLGDMPIYAAAEGGTGEVVYSTEPIEEVPRPWFLKMVRDPFGVLVTGESMSPAFEPGDVAIVNPALPTARDTNVILIGGEEAGEFKASIKRLLGWSATEWALHQHNPRRDFKLPRNDWPKALRIVGKLEGR